jgi:hypothetical protein
LHARIFKIPAAKSTKLCPKSKKVQTSSPQSATQNTRKKCQELIKEGIDEKDKLILEKCKCHLWRKD